MGDSCADSRGRLRAAPTATRSENADSPRDTSDKSSRAIVTAQTWHLGVARGNLRIVRNIGSQGKGRPLLGRSWVLARSGAKDSASAYGGAMNRLLIATVVALSGCGVGVEPEPPDYATTAHEVEAQDADAPDAGSCVQGEKRCHEHVQQFCCFGVWCQLKINPPPSC